VRYYDTSVLVKQYLQEAGSKLVLELLKSGEKVYTASLTYAETHAASAGEPAKAGSRVKQPRGSRSASIRTGRATIS
jgi:hypothetical protein